MGYLNEQDSSAGYGYGGNAVNTAHQNNLTNNFKTAITPRKSMAKNITGTPTTNMIGGIGGTASVDDLSNSMYAAYGQTVDPMITASGVGSYPMGSQNLVANPTQSTMVNPQVAALNKMPTVNDMSNKSAFTPYTDNSGMFGTQPYNEQLANYAQVSLDKLPEVGSTAYTDLQKGMQTQEEFMGTQGTDWMGGIGAGMDILGGITNIASYFDNSKLRDKQMEGIDANIANLKFAQNQRKDFVGNTKSSFA